ncbi:phosphatase PAP2 family protein [bacterium]|nr:phosphatase PAP2 family protein [bacterium]
MSLFRDKARLLELTLPLSILIVGTAVFYFTDLDLRISRHFYDPIEQKWWGDKKVLIHFSYIYGPYISGVIAFWALSLFFASFMHPRFLLKRGITLFVLLCIIIGPVIVVNGVFKDTWRRPRPRDTLELGGHHAFQKVLVIKDRNFKGRSFPSGHASSGFVLVMLYFLLKQKRPGMRYPALLMALFWGVWLGLVRIMTGGHFTSDVLWAFALVWYISYFLYYFWFPGYQQKLKQQVPFSPSRRRYAVGLSLIVIGVAALSFRFLSGAPFRIDYPFQKFPIPPSVQRLKITVRVKKGDISVFYLDSREISIGTWISGDALFDIQASRDLRIDRELGVWRIEYHVKPTGYYYQYQSHNSIYVPRDIEVEWDLFTELGSVFRYDLKEKKSSP